MLNLEYRIPIVSRVTFDLFNDAAINGVLRQSQLGLDPTAAASLQQQYPNPDFPNLKISNNLPILGGTNFRPHTSAGAEIVVFLPIVNAPFRFYYAYNYLRLTHTLRPPHRGVVFRSDGRKFPEAAGCLQYAGGAGAADFPRGAPVVADDPAESARTEEYDSALQ